MLNTYFNYQVIAKDVGKALERTEKQPLVKRDTEYYLANISKVKTIEDFVKDTRLFRYAMKAFGLEDMAYAKAFMVKAMKEGISNPKSFANKLADKRYADFVATFNFAALGDKTTVYNKAQHEVTANYATQATIHGVDPNSNAVKAETSYYLANIVKVKSVDHLMKNDRLLSYALKAYGFDPADEDIGHIRELLEGGLSDPSSPANKETDARYKAFVAAFDFQSLGEATTTYSKAQQLAVDKYTRQTLEENAGEQNEGVRLALYFERKAKGLTNFYQVLADPALSRVVRTALSLPDSFAGVDLDAQVKLFEKKLNIEDFSDPKKLATFLNRFTSLWDISNSASLSQGPMSVLFARPAEYGISTNLLLSIHSLRR